MIELQCSIPLQVRGPVDDEVDGLGGFFARNDHEEAFAVGRYERISLPTYMKDVYGVMHSPGQTMAHKANPLLKIMVDMLSNKDYYGVEIRHPDDRWTEQGKDLLTHAVESAAPLSIRNYFKEKQRGTPVSQQLRAAAGFGPAPSYINQTPAEELAQAYSEAKLPRGARTKEAFERSQLRSQLVRQFKLAQDDADKLEAARAAIKDALQSGKLSDKDITVMAERVQEGPLNAMVKHLSLEQALNVWDKASPKERQDLRQTLITKIGSASNLPASKIRELAPRVQALKIKPEETADIYKQVQESELPRRQAQAQYRYP